MCRINQPLYYFYLACFIAISLAIENSERIDCFPERESPMSNFSTEACLDRGCIYNETGDANSVKCYFRPNYGYIAQNAAQETDIGFRIQLKKNEAVDSLFPEPIENVVLDVEYYTNDIIRFKFYDADSERYQVPIPLAPSPGRASSPQYEFVNQSDPTNDNVFSFMIKRKANQATLFDTSLGGLVLNNQFLQIVTRLQSRHVYGFGENNHDTLKHNVDDRESWGIFARDQNTDDGIRVNNYGSHPFYLVMEQIPGTNQTPSGNMHGVLLLNSNAMDYSFTPIPSLTIRTIGGILDFFLFMGPKPEQVIQQYTWLIGRPMVPPYWALGFHLSRWDYGNLTNMKRIVNRNRDAGVPLDVQHADIDYMEAAKDFTIDPIKYNGLKEFFAELNADGVRTIIILDPGVIDNQIDYEPTISGFAQDVFVKWENRSESMKGACWPGAVFFPDFFTARTQRWWSQLIKDFRDNRVSFDGLWIDMNEPALFGTNEEVPFNWQETGSNHTLQCPESKLDDPPYRTKAVFRYDVYPSKLNRLSERTLCMSARQGENDANTGKPKYYHYDVHNLYGWSQTKPTLDAMQAASGKRGLILPRSTFVGSGQWSGHWLGDNNATWYEMKRSLIGMIEFNWFGIPFNGADICGYFKLPTEEMCVRWMQVGAFYPFSRNHNNRSVPDQDPAAWRKPALDAMITALRIRYTLLPYYYTLFYKAYTEGSTVIRPLFHEYPNDKTTLDIFLQFLVGSYLMVAPVTDDGVRQLETYFPSSPWYDFYTGSKISVQNERTLVDAPLEKIPLFLRGGGILPTQGFSNNTKLSRAQPFSLTIVIDSDGNAAGDLFYDDGESIGTIDSKIYFYATFRWSSRSNTLDMNVVHNNYTQMSNLTLDSLIFYGLDPIPSALSVGGKSIHPTIRPNTRIVEFSGLGLSMAQNHSIKSGSIKVNCYHYVSWICLIFYTIHSYFY